VENSFASSAGILTTNWARYIQRNDVETKGGAHENHCGFGGVSMKAQDLAQTSAEKNGFKRQREP
jgi:hypothetical protein